MNRLSSSGIILVIAAFSFPSLGYAGTTSGYDSILPELPIAVQGVAVLDLTQGNAIVDGNLAVTGGLSMQGEIKVGEDGTGCGGSTAGTIRYDGGSQTMQYCNGSSWQMMANGAASGSLCGLYVYGTGNGMAAGSATCQGVNPVNGCPGGYYQNSTFFQDSTGGNFTQVSCVKN